MEVKFASFNSSVNPGFWTSLSKLKLEVWGLEDKAVEVHARYENKGQDGLPSLMNVDWDAFDNSKSQSGLNWCSYSSLGNLVNYNTIDAFKKFDKNAFIQDQEGQNFKKLIESDKILDDPRLLTRFTVHTFADLKKYIFYYWFAFPAVVLPKTIQLLDKIQPINKLLECNKLKEFALKYQEWKKCHIEQSGFFWIQYSPEIKIYTLKEGMNMHDVTLVFADPSNLEDYPGWPLRNLLALIAHKNPQKLTKDFQIIALRQNAIIGGELSLESSKLLKIKTINDEKCHFDLNNIEMTGWEKNEKGQFAPKYANMRASMDPQNLAESSVDLNLKLMKWRLVPELDLSIMHNIKCLLLGSGTLGCNVARCLLGWGVKNITFVDNSKVSYSNPVRQSLFEFEDCLNGGKPKAQAAADKLTKIFPGVKTSGHNINIPMPGHPISDSMIKDVKDNFQHLENLIKDHDVIYLLMDTRESRWLPTVMAAHFGKLVINAALGFDSFLVMRHGVRNSDSWKDQPLTKLVPGCQLGCYFCNDVVAPGDSTKDRTLDQQCTVTRPGVSYQAAAFAVEIMVRILMFFYSNKYFRM